jgi:hypothetical protein
MSDDLGTPAIRGRFEDDFEVWRREVGKGFVRPFHEANPVSREIFVESCFKVFVRRVETIKIKVI